MNYASHLGGIYPALLTPFTASNEVNHDVLGQLVEYNVQKGVDGFYVGGSTAEAFLLTEQERLSIYETVANKVAGRARLIAHVGAVSTDEALRYAMRAKALGYDAISAVAPFYYGFSFAEIKQYYHTLTEKSETPMVMYNIPATSGVKLTTAQICEILSHPSIIGVKHTSNDFFALERVKSAYLDKVIFNGYDEMLLSGLAMGADGGIGSTYNYMAEKFIAIKALCDEGRFAEALPIQREANRIITILFEVGGMQMNKEVLCQMGFDFGTPRTPFSPLTDAQKEHIRREVTNRL